MLELVALGIFKCRVFTLLVNFLNGVNPLKETPSNSLIFVAICSRRLFSHPARRRLTGFTMEGSASVRKALSGTLVPLAVSTVALQQQPEDKEKGTQKRKVLDEEEYIEVNNSRHRQARLLANNCKLAGR